MKKDELRHCKVWNGNAREYEDGYFHGWFQIMDGNAEDGISADVRGVFENKYGEVRYVYVNSIIFTDREPKPEIKKSDWQ